jgi:hypothetical protein
VFLMLFNLLLFATIFAGRMMMPCFIHKTLHLRFVCAAYARQSDTYAILQQLNICSMSHAESSR